MPATANSGERSLLFAPAGRVSTSDPAGRASSVDPGGRSPLCAPAGGMRSSCPLGRPCAVPRRCLLCGFEGGCWPSRVEGGWIRDTSTLSPTPMPSPSAVSVPTYTSFFWRSPRARGVPDAVLRRSKSPMVFASIPSTSTQGSLRSVFGDVTGTLSLASGATPATLPTPERRSRISPTRSSSKYSSLASGASDIPAPGPNAAPPPDSGRLVFTTTSTRPMFSSAWMRKEFVRVSPVVNAAEKSTVASMRPTTIRAVCARRRGTFRTAILKEVRSRSASAARIRKPAPKTQRRIHINGCVGIPKSLSIVTLPTFLLVVRDQAVAHPDRAVGATGDRRVVGDEHEGQLLLFVQADEEVHDLPGCLGVQGACRFVRPHDDGLVDERAGDRHPLLLAAAHLGRELVRLLGDADSFEGGERPPARLFGPHACDQEGQLDILHGGEDRDQVVRLEDEAHRLRPEAGALSVGHAGDGPAADQYLSPVELVEAREAV